MSLTPNTDFEYVGFWPRVGASFIDGLLMSLVQWPLMIAWYGWAELFDPERTVGAFDLILSLAMILLVIGFWVAKEATPGKMLVHAKIVDAKTGNHPSTGQYVGRYFAYMLSALPFGLGFLWVAFDPRKQGWHDKLAGTVVVRPVGSGAPANVSFPNADPARWQQTPR